MADPEATTTDEADAFDPVLDSWRRSLPGIDVTSVSISVSVSRLAVMFNRAIEDLVRPYGFGYGEMEVLFYLLSQDKPFESRPSDLTKGCFVTSGAITGRVDRLERSGFVTRIPSLIDRREMMVRLTRAGEKLSRQLQLKIATESPMATVIKQIDPDRPAAIDTALRDLLKRIEAVIAQPSTLAIRKTVARGKA